MVPPAAMVGHMNARPMTPDEVAADLRVSRDTVLRKLRAGEIPGFRVGRAWRVDAEVYAEWKHRPAQSDPNRIAPRSARGMANIRRGERNRRARGGS